MSHLTSVAGSGPRPTATILVPAIAGAAIHDPPLPQHLNIVALETYYAPLPRLTVPEPHTFSLTEYARTTPAQVAERIRDADIVIMTTVMVQASALSAANAPKLRCIAVMAVGFDTIDLAACTERGIRVLNSPNCNTAAVAEHALSMYMALRRSLVPVMRALSAGEWATKGSVIERADMVGAPPRSCRDETVGVIGYGNIGQEIARLMSALGAKVIISDRRGAPPNDGSGGGNGRVPFETVLQQSTVLVVCCPLLPSTRNLIGAAEIAQMQPDAILVNVARGNIVNEEAVVAALRQGRIGGAGIDVFDTEPATQECSAIVKAAADGDLNLIATGHTAWVAASTRANYQRTVQENVERFILGKMDANRIVA
ncbi:hypothetical protein SEPCBS119000_001607 [Sporothrix epigloea]|uniref:Glycerate dehydrogenase n=1 Tax=Sporothrix epigloea TaxID=1892477 RepID=A0ABP0DEV0_9PEZI